MEFLNDYGISQDTINFLNDICSDQEKNEALYCCGYINSSIKYLISIGVSKNTIENILKYDHHILIAGGENIKKTLSNYKIEDIVKAINSDSYYYKFLYNY